MTEREKYDLYQLIKSFRGHVHIVGSDPDMYKEEFWGLEMFC